MKIGILTGGGDVPGLNPCIRALVYGAIDNGHQVLGIRRGWEGLLYINPDDPKTKRDYLVDLNKTNTRTIDRSGGTILHTSRLNPASILNQDIPSFLRKSELLDQDRAIHDLTSHVLKVLEILEIDVLVPIGGDDTLAFAARLDAENVPIVAIPKTMDNDVFGTDYTIGFSTAITRSVEYIHLLRTSSGSHERISVVELFGRKSGAACLMTAYLASVDRTVIPEVPFDPGKLTEFMVADRLNNPSRYAIVTISEGASFIDMSKNGLESIADLKQPIPVGRITVELIKEKSKVSTLYQHLAYLMRSGEPDSLDLMVAENYANLTLNLIASGNYGQMAALHGGCYTNVPVNTVTQGLKRVDVEEYYDEENYKPRVKSIKGKPMFLY